MLLLANVRTQRLRFFCHFDYQLILISVIDCGPPQIPTNGFVILRSGSTHPNDSVHYSCNTGYTLDGIEQRRCQENGLWSGDLPGCLGEESTHFVGVTLQEEGWVESQHLFCPCPFQLWTVGMLQSFPTQKSQQMALGSMMWPRTAALLATG